MRKWNNEKEARKEIKNLVAKYYHEFIETEQRNDRFKPGERVCYASRVFDGREMQSLTDSVLDFWLTSGRFTDAFESEFARWIGSKYVHLVLSTVRRQI